MKKRRKRVFGFPSHDFGFLGGSLRLGMAVFLPMGYPKYAAPHATPRCPGLPRAEKSIFQFSRTAPFSYFFNGYYGNFALFLRNSGVQVATQMENGSSKNAGTGGFSTSLVAHTCGACTLTIQGVYFSTFSILTYYYSK